jgi:hypothetical protein
VAPEVASALAQLRLVVRIELAEVLAELLLGQPRDQ